MKIGTPRTEIPAAGFLLWVLLLRVFPWDFPSPIFGDSVTRIQDSTYIFKLRVLPVTEVPATGFLLWVLPLRVFPWDY